MTRFPEQRSEKSFFATTTCWDPHGDVVAFTRILPFRYKAGAVVPVHGGSFGNNTHWISTIWAADVNSGRAWEVAGPMGDFAALSRTSQLEGASAYCPVFSPDGRSLWFLNAGCIYQIALARQSGPGAPRLIGRTGGLDFESPGASKAGGGAMEIAWDAKRHRLCYWIGRFWGTGWSEYGYIAPKGQAWSKPTQWNPAFSDVVLSAWPNVQGCAIDSKGNVWVRCLFRANDGTVAYQWATEDGRDRLPKNGRRPAFCP